MTGYYLDTSALSKRYVEEIGTGWIRGLTASESGNLILTARISMVEFYSAIARRRREGSVPAEACDAAAQGFMVHSASQYEFVELDLAVVMLARELLERHPLRAYDAVQLSSCLIANQALVEAGVPQLVFVSADERLNEAAQAEGLVVENADRAPSS